MDGVGVPLAKETELYVLHILDEQNAVLDEILKTGPIHLMPASTINQYQSEGASALKVIIRQVGQYGRSEPASLSIPI